MSKKEEKKVAYERALGIGEKKCMEGVIALLKSNPNLMAYLNICGLSETDLIAMAKQTLRGGLVARHLYQGMVGGFINGIESLNEQDEKSVEVVKDWLERDRINTDRGKQDA